MKYSLTSLLITVGLVLGTGCARAQGVEPGAGVKALMMQPAPRQSRLDTSMLLAAARAGKRIVAAGAQGTVMLSDDGGKTYRQASVPVRLQLTSLYFLDERLGWATGHGGLILNTVDGGEHWAVQHVNLAVDQPLFSVYFRNAQEGWAVGLWSMMLVTQDGGRSWNEVALPPAPGARKADLNLFKIFGSDNGTLYIAAERGFVLRSHDGSNWDYLPTGYQGSLWSGVAWADGTVLVGGLRGSLYRSTDGGQSWVSAGLGQTSSITALVKVGKAVYGAGFDGLEIASDDQGHRFKVQRRDDRWPLTALVPTDDGQVLAYSSLGLPPHNQLPVRTAP